MNDGDFRIIKDIVDERKVADRIPGEARPYYYAALSAFDKFCAATAFMLGIALLILGIIGFFIGSGAHFTLPPILGCMPALVGWGIVKSVRVAWGSQGAIGR